VGHFDYPGLLGAADAVSGRKQSIFLRLTGATLLLAVLAAVTGALSARVDMGGGTTIDVPAAVAVLAFAGMVVLTFVLIATRPERGWYSARAVAESVKSSSWQYAVGGGEFSPLTPGPPAEAFVRLLGQIVDQVVETDGGPGDAGAPIGIRPTATMDELRGRALPERVDAYAEGRVANQSRWYRGKARSNARRANQLLVLSIAVQIAGLTVAAAAVARAVDADLTGMAAAAVGAATAWSQARDYESLAQAYRTTIADLSRVADELALRRDGFTDESWADFVDTAEQAISREHTLWLARRGVAPRR